MFETTIRPPDDYVLIPKSASPVSLIEVGRDQMLSPTGGGIDRVLSSCLGRAVDPDRHSLMAEDGHIRRSITAAAS